MYDLHLLDADLVFRRPPTVFDADLVDIEFADMEPVDADDLVGVFPHEARATVPLEPYDVVGVIGHAAVATAPSGPPREGRPFEGPMRPEDLETEEYLLF